jgi:hypothetical protein
MILSFAWTTDDFIDGNKTATRRFCSERNIKTWQAQWDKGNHVHKAYDKAPFVPGAKQIGWFRLTRRPYQQQLSEMTFDDLAQEGTKVMAHCSALPGNFPEFVNQEPDAVALVIEFEQCEAPEGAE